MLGLRFPEASLTPFIEYEMASSNKSAESKPRRYFVVFGELLMFRRGALALHVLPHSFITAALMNYLTALHQSGPT